MYGIPSRRCQFRQSIAASLNLGIKIRFTTTMTIMVVTMVVIMVVTMIMIILWTTVMMMLLKILTLRG